MIRPIRHRCGAVRVPALVLLGLLLMLPADPVAAQLRIPDHFVNARLFCHISASGGALSCASPNDALSQLGDPRRDSAVTQAMAELLQALAQQDVPFACDDDGAYFLRGSMTVAHKEMASLAVDCTARRGGPRNSDSLLRWDPDQGKGVWHTTEATELSC